MSTAAPPRRDRSRTGDVRIVWVRARARNVARRPMLIAAVAAAAFIGALLLLLLVPREASRAARQIAPRPDELPDTSATLAAIDDARARVAAADSSLARAIELMARPPVEPATVESLPPATLARRDSLANALAALTTLVARAQSAPLFESWRELANAPPMRDDPRVRTLLDTLGSIERERDAFGAVGGVDPVFVALTSRATAVGRTIQSVAEEKSAALRRAMDAMRPAAPPPPAAPIRIDTVPLIARRDSAAADLDAAIGALQAQRRQASELAQRTARARELANVHAPPVAMLGAALVLGIALGFAAALLLELRRPRVADAREAERVAAARVFTIGPHTPPPERSRRRSDLLAPPLIDTSGQRYRLPYLHLAAAGASVPILTVTGSELEIVAVAAANLAALATHEARSALLVDADPAHGAVAGVARVRPSPGFGDVIAGRASWAEVLAATLVGRERVLEVIPGGHGGAPGRAAAESLDELRQALLRLARRYDFAVLAAALAQAQKGTDGILPGSDVVLCVRVAHTGVAELRASARSLRAAGLTLRAILLWEGEVPRVPTAEELDAALRAAEENAYLEEAMRR